MQSIILSQAVSLSHQIFFDELGENECLVSLCLRDKNRFFPQFSCKWTKPVDFF